MLSTSALPGRPRPGDGRACGTLGYAAPEALTGARTPASDSFALGATLYEAWSGAPPFGRGLPAVQRMLTGRAPPLSSVRAGAGRRVGPPASSGCSRPIPRSGPPAHAR